MFRNVKFRYPFPTDLRPRLPTIVGNVDYLTLCQRLEQIESLLQAGGLEVILWRIPAGLAQAQARLPASHRPAATAISIAQPAGAALHDLAHAAARGLSGL